MDHFVQSRRRPTASTKCLGATHQTSDFLITRLNSDGSLDNGAAGDADPSDYFGSVNTKGYLQTDFSTGQTGGSGGAIASTDLNFTLALENNPSDFNSLKLIAAGSADVNNNGNSDFAVARYDLNGIPDTANATGFGPLVGTSGSPRTGKVTIDFAGGNDTAYAGGIDAAGNILLAGVATAATATGTGTDFALARLDRTGTLDPTFGNAGKLTTDFGARGTGAAVSTDVARSMTLMPDGRIVLAGYAQVGTNAQIALARYQPTNKIKVLKVTAPVVTAVPIQATAGQEFDGVIATFIPAASGTQSGDYSASPVNWSDGSNLTETPEIFDNGDGTFSVWEFHTFPTSGTYSALVTIKHIASNLSGSATTTAVVTNPPTLPTPTAPAKPTGLTATAISSTEIGLVWDHIPNATNYTITRTGGSGSDLHYPLSDPLANSYFNSSLEGHTPYTYTLIATNAVGNSPESDAVTISTPNGLPDMLTDAGYQGSAVQGGAPFEIYATSLADRAMDPDTNDTRTIDPNSLSPSRHGGTVSMATNSDGQVVVRYTPPSGYIGPDSFTYAVTDGIATSQKGTVEVSVIPSPDETSDSETIYLRQGGSVPFSIPSGTALAGGPSHGTYESLGNNNYIYHPDPTFTGRDAIFYEYPDHPRYRINFIVGENPVKFIPYRTGLKTDHQVLQATKLLHNPADYVILTNNNHDENHADGSADNTDHTAYTSYINPDPHTGLPAPNLAQFQVVRPPQDSGTLSLVVDHPSSVHLFKDDGTELQAADYNYDFANPSSSYIGSGGGLWLEGVTPNPDLKISLVFKSADGTVICQDDVHMNIAEWTFVGSDGNQVDAVAPLWQDTLLASGASPIPTVNDPGGSFYKSRIEGLLPTSSKELQVRSDAKPADSYKDVLDTVSGKLISKNFATLYSTADIYRGTADYVTTASERSRIMQSLGLNVVHNPKQRSTLTTGTTTQPAEDSFERKLGAAKLSIKIDKSVVHKGDLITGSIDRLGADNSTGRIRVTIGDFNDVLSPYGAEHFTFQFTATFTGDIPVHAYIQNTLLSVSSLVLVLPVGAAWTPWHQAARDALQIDGSVPINAINRNRKITELYAGLFNTVPTPIGGNPYEWFGLAAFASKGAGDGMSQAKTYGWAPVNLLSLPDLANVEQALGEGNLRIFMDMYPQGLAYQAGGIAEIRAMKVARAISANQLLAWENIDAGIKGGSRSLVLKGTYQLADVEQRITLQPVLDANPALWVKVTDNWLSGQFPLKSPFPGNIQTFTEYRATAANMGILPANASFGNATARMDWFRDQMLPGWRQNWRANNATIDVEKLLNGQYK